MEDDMLPPNGEYWQNWEPKFLILKGSEVCFFDTPPMNSTDLTNSSQAYKIYETSLKILKNQVRKDERRYCFWIESAVGVKHYCSIEMPDGLESLEGAWHRATYYAVQRLEVC